MDPKAGPCYLFNSFLVLAEMKENSWLISLFLAIYLAFFSSMSLVNGSGLFVIVLPKYQILSTQGVGFPPRRILGSIFFLSSQAIHFVLDLAGFGSMENLSP